MAVRVTGRQRQAAWPRCGMLGSALLWRRTTLRWNRQRNRAILRADGNAAGRRDQARDMEDLSSATALARAQNEGQDRSTPASITRSLARHLQR